jgi:glycosyltransferase involved in cell wall biosynthesis
MSQKKVAVLIPTLNEEKTLKFLLDSLNKNPYRNKEIVIIDGGSKDKTIEIAKKAGATVLMETGKKKDMCPANAWNQGAKYAKADILVFLDADIVDVNNGFISNGVKLFDEKTIAVYAGYKTVQDTLVERVVSKREGISMHPTFVRKDVFMTLGGYPLIGYGEDELFADAINKYASKMGLEVKQSSDSYWTGHAVRGLVELYKQKKWYGRTSFIYIKMLRGGDIIKGLIRAYTIPVYLISFITLLLVPISPAFLITAIPFFLVFLLTIIRNPGWGAGKVFINLISGFAVLHGMLVYLFSENARKGR